jgi:hypothetical protein
VSFFNNRIQNSIAGGSIGLSIGGVASIYNDNIVTGFTTAFFGVTDGGGNVSAP